MSIKREEIVVRARFNNTELSKGLRTAGHQVTEWANDVGKKLAALFAVEKVFEFTKGLIEFGSKIADTAERLNVTTAEVQKLTYAAKLSGLELDDVAAAFDRLAKAKNKALEPGKSGESMRDAFSGLGIAIADLQALSPDELFQKISEHIAATGANSTTAANAMEVFGRSGAKLIPMLKEYTELRKQAPIVSAADLRLIKAVGDATEASWMKVKAASASMLALVASGVAWKRLVSQFTHPFMSAADREKMLPTTKAKEEITPENNLKYDESRIIDKALQRARSLLKLQEFTKKNAADKVKAEKQSLDLQTQILRLEEKRSQLGMEAYMPTLQQLANSRGPGGAIQRRINWLTKDATNALLKGNTNRAQGDISTIEGTDVPIANLTPWQKAQNAAQAALNKKQGWNHALPFDPGGYHVDGLKDSLRNMGLQPKDDKLQSIDTRLEDLNAKIAELNKTASTNGIILKDAPTPTP